MKLPVILPLLAALTLSSIAQNAPPPPSWTSADGKAIQAEFVRLDGDKTLVVRMNGKEVIIPMARLSLASREQARKLAAAAAPPPAAEPDAEPAKTFGKQTDPDHQRKLAEAMLARRAEVWIWKEAAGVQVTRAANLPNGRVSLKEIHAVGISFSNNDAALLNGCRELVKLTIHRADLEGLPLDSLPALVELDLADVRIPPSGLRGLRGSRSLRGVHFGELRHPDNRELVNSLATCPKLEWLRLHTKGLYGASLAHLARLNNLISLSLAGSDIAAGELQALTRLPALESLNLEGVNLADGQLAWLAGLKTVNTLNLTNCRLPEGALAQVAAMRGLRDLNLGSLTISPADFQNLAACRSLTNLGLMNTNLNQQHLVNMKPLFSLGHLAAAGSAVVIDDAAAKELARVFPHLQSCNVSARGMGQAGCQSLAALRRLTQLHLHDCDLEVAAAVAQIKTLTNVALTGPAVSSAEVARLKPLAPSLIELLLPNTRIDDAVEDTLVGFRRLKVLEIVGTGISRNCVFRLRKALPGCEIRY